MSNCNSTNIICSGCCLSVSTSWLFFTSSSCTWWVNCCCWWFSIVWSSNLLLCCTRFHILIVSCSSSCCLRLIGCWTLSIIVGGWTDCTSICRFVSATYWLRIVTCLTIWQCIWWNIGSTTIFLFSIHSDCIYCIIMVGLSDFLSPIMNIILYRNINFYSKICSI